MKPVIKQDSTPKRGDIDPSFQCIEDSQESLVIVGTLTKSIRQAKSTSVRVATEQRKLIKKKHSNSIIDDTDEELEEDIKIETDSRFDKGTQMSSRKIQTIKYKSKIWVQDAVSKPQ